MLILAGQGNPGPKYAGNRHNAGFLVIDRIHADHGFGPWRSKFESQISEGTINTGNGRVKVLLVKPETFYNETGGHSGNNGVRSMIAHLGENVRRVRIGIGHPGDKSQVMPYVLSDFSKADRDWFEPLQKAISDALPYLAADDDERFQTEVMRLAPAPKHDPKQAGRS